ncbi:MAG: 2-phospho-L-lactate transferase [Candidatus Hecatellales archaeon]|nr:MAG: 2-phospho-L-lactate transferase [Candidatus Hecatellales archaeon]
MKITVFAGGTGSAKFVRGLAKAVPQKNLTVVVNVGDNIRLYGLTICPDLDTILYMFAGILDRVKGWGIAKDTFNFQKMLKRYGLNPWFNLGDKDLATHIYRTNLIMEGLNLTEATKTLAKKLGVKTEILPATNNWVETRIVTSKGKIHFQEFWVKKHGKPKVLNIIYEGVEKAKPNPKALKSIAESDAIIISPANPITSIKPILAIPRMVEALKKTKAKVLAISPIIGDSPVSGPAGKLMKSLGLKVSPYTVAELYKEFLDIIVIHKTDKKYVGKIEKLGIKCFQTNILMKNLEDEERLAKFTLKVLNLSP